MSANLRNTILYQNFKTMRNAGVAIIHYTCDVTNTADIFNETRGPNITSPSFNVFTNKRGTELTMNQI